STATTIGYIPDLYFQAVGSGTGAIAAWEANLRLIGDGRFGTRKMKLWLSQNFPFHPMVDAWKARSRDLFPMEDQKARELVSRIDAKVLSNRKPPYAISGGLFDALTDTGGEMVVMTNEEAATATGLFAKLEGIDIHPAAAVATASLIAAVERKEVPADAVIMLNITGGGEERLKREKKDLVYLQPSLIIDVEITREELFKKLKEIF
ncbi:MAG: pyridoxal-phosphate dependent enzyme, partial [bacterium]